MPPKGNKAAAGDKQKTADEEQEKPLQAVVRFRPFTSLYSRTTSFSV